MLNNYTLLTTTMATPTSSAASQQTLNLRHLRVGPKILTSLQHPKYQTSLHSLCLGPIFSSTVTLATILESLPSGLRTLDLDVSYFGSDHRRGTSCASRSGPELDWQPELQKFWKGLPPRLDKLCLRFAKNDKAGILALAKTIHHCSSSSSSSLTTLDLRNNGMDDAIVVALALALEHCPTIRHLVLSFNTIGKEGAVALADALNSTNLQSLDLSHNTGIDDAAIEVFCRALETNSQLQELNLYGCNITNNGIEHLLNCLKGHNWTLQRIHLTSKRPIRHDREPPSEPQPSNPQQRKELIHQMEYWLSLNRAGRELVRREGEAAKVPSALWPHVLARTPKPNRVTTFRGPHELFFLIKENPALFDPSQTSEQLL